MEEKRMKKSDENIIELKKRINKLERKVEILTNWITRFIDINPHIVKV
jgi:hypothetical protein